MDLSGGRHLGYCSNIHPAESWEATFAQLQKHIPLIKRAVCPGSRFGIGLRLSARAAAELDAAAMLAFKRWLEAADCYVFTINGFPYGAFHGTAVKAKVYRPDWTSPRRLAYTNCLFDRLAELLPEDLAEGSVSTLPGSFKGFGLSSEGVAQMQANLGICAGHIARIRDKRGKDLHLGLEPEPMGFFETSEEAVDFFKGLVAAHGDWILPVLGVNYDTCHLAVEYESPTAGLDALADAGIRLSKIHLSSALRLDPSARGWELLAPFADGIYLHQTIIRESGKLRRVVDLPEALAAVRAGGEAGEEWRVHFHIPLSDEPAAPLRSTRDHIEGTLAWLASHPTACRHLEMETYTWDVLPPAHRRGRVEDQLIAEYGWTLEALKKAGLA